MDNLTQEINLKFDNNFKHLKLLEVVYEKQSQTCSIVFLYPSNMPDISDSDRHMITTFLKEYLDIKSTLNIKFRKSYIEKSFILRELDNYFLTNFVSIGGQIVSDDYVVNIDGTNVEITVKLFENFLEYFDDNDISSHLARYLESRFCAKFIVSKEKKEMIDESQFQDRKLKMLEAMYSFTEETTKRYSVISPIKFIGEEITPKPEFISNIQEEKLSVILAGVVQKLQKKEYVRKNDKKQVPRQLYSFSLKDKSGEIQTTYFCPKGNEKKMDTIIDGSNLLMIGDVKNGYNKRLCFYAKSISLCTIDFESIGLNKQNETKIDTSNYKFVLPEQYIETAQQGLFYKSPVYDEYILNNNFVVFDVETTGLNADVCDIIEIGAVKVENGKITQKFQTLIKPRELISEYITSINGITNSMVEQCRFGEELIGDFYKFCEGCILVGYNVNFDYQFIQKLANKVGLNFNNDISDAMDISKKKLKLTNYKLITVVKSLDLTLENAHRAYFDALATAKVFLKLHEII